MVKQDGRVVPLAGSLFDPHADRGERDVRRRDGEREPGICAGRSGALGPRLEGAVGYHTG